MSAQGPGGRDNAPPSTPDPARDAGRDQRGTAPAGLGTSKDFPPGPPGQSDDPRDESQSPRAVGRPPIAPGSADGEPLPGAEPGDEPAMPHERDESIGSTADAPDPVIEQAKSDLDAGMVDTDLRATPGLDAERREKLLDDERGDGAAPPTGRALDAGGADRRD